MSQEVLQLHLPSSKNPSMYPNFSLGTTQKDLTLPVTEKSDCALCTVALLVWPIDLYPVPVHCSKAQCPQLFSAISLSYPLPHPPLARQPACRPAHPPHCSWLASACSGSLVPDSCLYIGSDICRWPPFTCQPSRRSALALELCNPTPLPLASRNPTSLYLTSLWPSLTTPKRRDRHNERNEPESVLDQEMKPAGSLQLGEHSYSGSR